MASCPAGHQVRPAQAGRCPQCRRTRVTDIVSAADGSLPRAVIEAAVAAAAPSGQSLAQLALALDAGPVPWPGERRRSPGNSRPSSPPAARR